MYDVSIFRLEVRVDFFTLKAKLPDQFANGRIVLLEGVRTVFDQPAVVCGRLNRSPSAGRFLEKCDSIAFARELPRGGEPRDACSENGDFLFNRGGHAGERNYNPNGF